VKIFILMIVIILTACSSSRTLEDPPIITSASRQHTLYNGKEQPIEAKTAKEDSTAKQTPPPLEITYFLSEADLLADRNGTSQAPTEIGYYYVRNAVSYSVNMCCYSAARE
jgi:hypothetical protein